MDEAQLEAVATEVAEAVPALRKFFSLPRDQQVVVVKHLLDKQIGTDETAQIKSLPGMNPSMTEMVTDPLLGVAANAILKLIAGSDEPEAPE